MKIPKLPHRLLPILIAAALFSISFEPLPFWFAAYFFIPVFIATFKGLSFWQGFRSGYLFGALISIILLYWVNWVTITGFVAIVFGHSAYYGLIAGTYSGLTSKYGKRALFLLPFIWVAVEYIRSLSQFSFPWLNLSYTQTSNLAIVQLAELSGDLVVSFFVVTLGSLFYLGFHNSRYPLKATIIFFSAIVLYTAVYFWGVSRLKVPNPDYLVSVAQGNVPNEMKWQNNSIDHNVENYSALTSEAANESAQLIIWPETAMPGYLSHKKPYQNWLTSIAARDSINILTGSLYLKKDDDGKSHYFNSAYYFTSEGVDDKVYLKRKLVPFSEHIPWEENLDIFDPFREFLSNQFGLDISDFEPGQENVLYESDQRKFAALICFEVVYPNFVRNVVNNGADFLAVITNDAWFGETAGPYQHAAITVFRAVENRCWIVRAANTGISEIVNPNGRIIDRIELGERGQLTAKIGNRTGVTLFNKYGSQLANFCLAVFIVCALILLIGRKQNE